MLKLKGLFAGGAAQVTKPGVYVSANQKKAVRCSLKADDGYLFPLERSFFYITKPCTMMPYDEVDEIEFQRQGGQLSLSSAKTFDIKVGRSSSNMEPHALFESTLNRAHY